MKRRIAAVGVVGAVVTAVVAVVLAPSASARWAYGNGATDLELNSDGPPNTTQVCANRIHGNAGASAAGDPATFVAPPGPYGTRTVDVYASDQSLDGSTPVAGGLKRLDDVVVPPAVSFTTSELTLLTPFGEYQNFIGEKFSVYASAPFDIRPAAGVINVGDFVAVKLQNRSAYITTIAIACGAPPDSTTTTTTSTTTSTTTTSTTTTSSTTTVPSTTTTTVPSTTTTTIPTSGGPRIDILPGVSPNFVLPWLNAPVLPVRVFGSPAFNVAGVTSVQLGTAPAVTFTGPLSYLTAIRDRNGDGFADRDFYFAPAKTGIRCSSRTATLTGSNAGTAFSATDSVRPIFC